MPPERPGSHLYVYAVTAGPISGRAAARVPVLPGGSTPRAVSVDSRMSALVADVASGAYSEAALERSLQDPDWVSKCGAAHHAAVEALARSQAVVPFRFLTVFSSEAKALAALRRSRPRLARALARVKDRQEWVLRIGAPQAARAERSGTDRAQKAATGTSFLRAKADARREERARAERAASEAVRVFEVLSALADAAAARHIDPGTALLLDAAFLVKTEQTTAFKRTLKDAARELLRDGCAVTMTGPWPPYSFASE